MEIGRDFLEKEKKKKKKERALESHIQH